MLKNFSKKRLLVTLFTASLLVFGLISYGYATPEVYNLNVKINPESLATISQELYTKGNAAHFNKDMSKIKKEQAFINLNLRVTPSDNPKKVNVVGNGVISILNETFPFSVNDELYKMETIDNKLLYFGPLTGIVNSKKGINPFIIGLEFIPTTNQISISTSVGELQADEGMGLLLFGDSFLNKEQVDLINNFVE